MVFSHAYRCAEVAELVDALGSGSSARTGVGVRISPSAPQIMLRVSLRLATIGKPFFIVVTGGMKHFEKVSKTGIGIQTLVASMMCSAGRNV